MPHVIFVHGAWVGPDSWDAVRPLVEAAGHTTEAVGLPLTGLADDARAVRAAVDAARGPVVLVGHSYGGAVVTAAAADEARVAHLVFVAAVVPDAGESCNAVLGLFPQPPAGQYIEADADARLTIRPDKFPEVFAQDLPADVGGRLAAAQRPTLAACFADTFERAAWETIPSTFVISRDDRTVHPDAQRAMAKRAASAVVELSAGHASPLSRPREVAAAVVAAARPG